MSWYTWILTYLITFKAIVFNTADKIQIGDQTDAPVKVGEQNTNSVDPVFLAARLLNQDGAGQNAHCFSDSSAVYRPDKMAYASYDARCILGGSTDYGHYAGFQSAVTNQCTGNVDHFYHHFSSLAHNQGNITNLHGHIIKDAAGAGTIENNYGITIEELTKGSAVNLAINVLGDTKSVLGGEVETKIITLPEITTPAPDANKGKIYTKADNNLYFQDGAGTEHQISLV